MMKEGRIQWFFHMPIIIGIVLYTRGGFCLSSSDEEDRSNASSDEKTAGWEAESNERAEEVEEEEEELSDEGREAEQADQQTTPLELQPQMPPSAGGLIGGQQQLAPPTFFAPSAELKEEEKKTEVEKAKEKAKKKPPVIEEKGWEEKTTKFFEMSGYFRFRSDLFYRLDMGFPPDNPHAPFPVPYESRYSPEVRAHYGEGEAPCGATGDHPKWCGKRLLTSANIRLRIEPTIHLSELVRIRSQIDILDNLVLGSTPEGYSSIPGSNGGFDPPSVRNPWVPIIAFSTTQEPPSWRNSLQNPVSVRTVWGEVLLKNIGMLKFGRMPSSWGLGVLANDGSCLDCDYGDIADRVLFATKLFGTVFAAGWDFPASGPTSQKFTDMQGQPYDVSVRDDLHQWLGVIAYKVEKEEEERRLAEGKPVFSGGVYYLYRKQLLSAMEGDASPGEDDSNIILVERDAWAHIADLWLQFLIGDFRAELEWVIIGGKIGNIGLNSYTGESADVLQYGGALQLEHKFLNDSLIFRFEAGYASGDENIEGLTPQKGLLTQEACNVEGPCKGEDKITLFRFDPDYNVDLILFEQLLRQVAGAYYFKPTLAYWFVKNHFYGQIDIIYSRASEPMSTNSNNGNLGVEFDITLKYLTKDRFVGMLQYAYLIPLPAWKDLEGAQDRFTDLRHPMTLQLMLAITY